MQQHSAILIIPAALKPQADAVGAALGWGEVSYTIALTDDLEGQGVTHYAARADVSSVFLYVIKLAQGEDVTVPDDLVDAVAAMKAAVADAPSEIVDPVIAALIADFSPDPTYEGDDPPPVLWGRAHLDKVLEAMGQQLVQEVEI